MDQSEFPNPDPNIIQELENNNNDFVPVKIVSESYSDVIDTKAEVFDVVEVVQQTELVAFEVKPLSLLLIPSLKGKMTYEGGQVKCKGVWGMSDNDHNIPGHTSDFEFKLVARDDDSPIFPVNGKYQGWFHLKQALPLKGSLKIEDKELLIKFTPLEGEDGKYSINGQGFNKFGSFTLKGMLTSDGDIHLYREYYNLNVPAVVHTKRRLSGTGGGDDSVKKAKAVVNIVVDTSIDTAATSGGSTITPREGSGRVRKQSTLMKEYHDTSIAKPLVSSNSVATATTTNTIKNESASVPIALVRQDSSVFDRAQRLSQPMKKCIEVLKEMSKNPLGIWFSEPVDYLKLNLPDYPVIVTKPMDFGTIRGKIESNVYEKPENFAEDMRLVFRNAITFNSSKDNAVHIAARELSNKFESRYRVLISQLNGEDVYSAGAVIAMETVKPPRPSLSGKSSSKTSRLSLEPSTTSALVASSSSSLVRSNSKSHSTKNTYATQQQPAAGPRVSSIHPYHAPAHYALDGGSSQQLLEMQKVMQAMQAEINSLKSVVRENDIVKKLQETKEAAHNPLTLQEKKTLIAEIHKLPAIKMETVLEIIQSALPPQDSGKETDEGEMEVPLDMLDTFTLRKLQKYIEENSTERKKIAMQRQNSINNIGNKETGIKRPRKPKQPTSSSDLLPEDSESLLSSHLQHDCITTTTSIIPNSNNDLGLFPDDESALLFETDSFEELRAQNTIIHHSHNDDENNNHNNDAQEDNEQDRDAEYDVGNYNDNSNDIIRNYCYDKYSILNNQSNNSNNENSDIGNKEKGINGNQ